MLHYQSIGNGYQWSYNWLLAFTSAGTSWKADSARFAHWKEVGWNQFREVISTFQIHMSLSNCQALHVPPFLSTCPLTVPAAIFGVNPHRLLFAVPCRALVVSAVPQSVGQYVKKNLHMPVIVGSDTCNSVEAMGTPTISAILTGKVIAAKDSKTRPAVPGKCQKTWSIKPSGNCHRLSFQRNVDRDKRRGGGQAAKLSS